MREWKLCEDGVFIIGRYLSPVPGPVSGTYWELQKHLSIKQSNRCLLLRPRQGENEQLESHIPVPACQGGAGTEAQSDRPSGEASGREQTEAKNPQAPQAVAPAPGKTALSRWRPGASQRVPIKARPQFIPS